MTKQKRNTALSELINQAKIFETINTLMVELKTYRDSARTKENRYEVQREINGILEEMSNTINQLVYLADKSTDWEAPE
jgi:hypothetical protein